MVFILGATGTGKTKVAIDMAQRFTVDSSSRSETTNNASKKVMVKKKKKSDDDDEEDDDDDDDQMVTIVNMDALQVHEELPIATARVLVEGKGGEEEDEKGGGARVVRGRWD